VSPRGFVPHPAPKAVGLSEKSKATRQKSTAMEREIVLRFI
jgi:hypothetical protein